MRKHPSRNDILKVAIEPRFMTEVIKKHFDVCDSCRLTYQLSLSVMEPSPMKLPDPETGILDKIVADFRQGAARKPGPDYRGLLKLIQRPAAAALLGLTLTVIVIISFISFHKTEMDTMVPAADIIVTDKDGISPVSRTLASLQGIIETGRGVTTIALHDMMKVSIEENSYFTVDRAEMTPDGKRHYIAITLRSGTLHARLVHGTALESVFITPHGTVTPLGTEFRLTVSGKSAIVLLKEGIIGLRSSVGKDATMRPGDKAIMGRTITLSAMGQRDRAFFGKSEPTVSTKRKNHGISTAPDTRTDGNGNNAEKEDGSPPKNSMEKVRKNHREGLSDMKDLKDMRRSGRGGRN